MATLDVSRVLLDPKFASRGIVCHRTKVDVGANGRSQKTETTHTFSGVVTTNDGSKMDRRPDGTLIKGAINIHTRFALSSGDAGYQADEITWKGRRYIVSQVLDNTQYGRGFVKAICEIKPLSG
ncbi:hypothetical protein [Acinetobacter sp. YH16053]|uniref:hypothetical protein n=1 Tax=Acinetobacter sp. YH16053 TaxID=2601192 RepID=UPI0015D20720